MATAAETSTAVTESQGRSEKTADRASDPVKIDVTRLPTDEHELEDLTPQTTGPSRTILHIYFEQSSHHKQITPVLSPSQERRFGPTPKQQKQRRIAKKAERKLREATQLTDPSPAVALPSPGASVKSPEEQSYILHTPYLSFHLPPSVLYICPSTTPSRYAPARPVLLVHTGWFWRSYKIQLGPALSLPGVIDPRGVVSWAHNGGSKQDLQRDAAKLRGYKVRGWRLWGETGKRYVHSIRERRRTGVEFADPDVDATQSANASASAEEVVHLTWTRPLSRQTRLYSFTFRGIEFQWKGTGTVSEDRKCGWMLRFCHLKLVARIPLHGSGRQDGTGEVCLGKYTSSIAAEKSGTVQVFDEAVLRFVDEWMPGLLEDKGQDGEKDDDGESTDGKMERLKQGMLYHLIVATVICMANAEKEKRHTLIDIIIGAAENGGNGGG